MALDFLRKGYIGLEEYDSLIMDECHRARKYDKKCTHLESCACKENRPPHASLCSD